MNGENNGIEVFIRKSEIETDGIELRKPMGKETVVDGSFCSILCEGDTCLFQLSNYHWPYEKFGFKEYTYVKIHY
ncbi:Uncharacterized protein TCM_035155 [Theobroma cacao]|uniref:Uncharacterized protein n=1 Tax=Theobroma cacao TaxID=3641 RepID=A0A061FI25_THECC|nr:Uncharacterized protein TCM_035155 [Theobroma cacao]